MTTLGERLRELRRSRKITSEDLGDALGVSGEAVRLWETDKRFPRKEYLDGICNYFGVSYDYIMGTSPYKTDEERRFWDNLPEGLSEEDETYIQEKAIYGDDYDFLRKYWALTPPHKQSVNEMVDLYYEKDKDK